MTQNDLHSKNRRMLVVVFAVVFGMVGLSFAAVPLYKIFCQVTGFGGTTQMSAAAPDADQILERTINVKFNADVSRNVLWKFHADQRQIDVKLGQQGLMSFSAKNEDSVPVTAVAVYNVTPLKAGKYFHKIACFCFGEQSLNPGGSATYPVVFFIDPKMDEDPNMDDVTTITLSYMFFQTDTPELEKAIEDFNVEMPDPATSGTVALPTEKQ